MNKRKIVFAYIPDYLFINDEKTPYGLLCLKEVLESSNQYTAEIWDYNLNLFNRTTLIISKKPGNTGISRDIRTEFTTDLLLSD